MQAKHWKKLTDEEKQLAITWGSEGVGITEIVKRLNNKVSKQRIKQILDRAGVPVTAIKREKIQKERNEKMFKKWGQRYADKEWRRSAIYEAMREKFRNKKSHTYNCEFSIDFGDIDFPTHCPVLGMELDYFADGREENSPSFDRVDPNKGYIKGNVVIMSWRANRIKNDGSAHEHEKIAKFMYSYLQQPAIQQSVS
jgi:hypothetical protein